LFVEKTVDVVGLHHHPPDKAVVLCTGEKSQFRLWTASQPVLPMVPGTSERRTHVVTTTTELRQLTVDVEAADDGGRLCSMGPMTAPTMRSTVSTVLR
jgi:hypothetical protein